MEKKFIEVVKLPYGTNKLSLHTDFPSPFPPGVSDDHLIVSAEVRRGKVMEYASKNFTGVLIKFIDATGAYEAKRT